MQINSDIDFLKCPAKTYKVSVAGKNIVYLGRSVLEHCLIVGYLAEALLNRMPFSPKIRALFPEQTGLIAALHDIGKLSPIFFIRLLIAAKINWRAEYPELLQLPVICDFFKQYGKNDEKSLAMQLKQFERDWGGHAGVSALVLRNETVTASSRKTQKHIASIVGQHHGSLPANIFSHRFSDHLFGDTCWKEGRYQVMEAIKQAMKVDWPVKEKLSDIQKTIISGLVVVADWIGSGWRFDDPQDDWQSRIDSALQGAGYLPYKIKPDLTFEQIFNFPPREAQSKLIAACQQPGVYILEAPMGIGKTEAALYAAYQCLAQGNASGIYFALPTQLTSNKIHQRFKDFLDNILSDDSPHKQALLLHGNAWLEKTEMGAEGNPGESWFDSKKRGLLAPFAVGTLDQALLSVINVRHYFVRAFGLLGKVVILDEVHTYDSYTGTLLNALIRQLKEMQCTVIILSATLTASRRNQFFSNKDNNYYNNDSHDIDPYPLISLKKDEQPIQTIPVTPPPSYKINIQLKQELAPVIEEALARVEQGQQVLWIENTVAEAQTRYEDLAARCKEIYPHRDTGQLIGLLHARYTAEHRNNNEEHWIHLLGKSGHPQRQQHGRLLIGTQVVEQSLDIDADFLISRFAPIDMILQRLGRLWRHQNSPRPPGATCEAWLLAPLVDEAINQPVEAFGKTAFVYDHYVLCRSLQALQSRLAQSPDLILPDDIRPLITASYAQEHHDTSQAQQQKLAALYEKMDKKRRELCQRGRSATAQANNSLPDEHVQTRYSEDENATILLFKAIEPDASQKITRLTLLNNQILELPWQQTAKSPKQWRQLSATIMRQAVHCRQSTLPGNTRKEYCTTLGFQNVLYCGKQNESGYEYAPFVLALINETDELHCVEGASSGIRYHYNDKIGLKKLPGK